MKKEAKRGGIMKIWRLRETALMWAALFSVVIFFSVSSHADAQNASGTGKVTLSDFKLLKGKWQRPDGGYLLELKQLGKGGALKAAYFNPRPINVSRAELKRRGNELTVFVELRDVNYPGSRYSLQYDPGLDRLTGTYFQAVHGETYTVEFLRVKCNEFG
jgi:uncharacterized protein (DUF2147 family)